MKFDLYTADTYYDEPDKDLMDLGFTFDEKDVGYRCHIRGKPSIELNTAEDFIRLIDKVGCSLVVDNDSIYIYDGYME